MQLLESLLNRSPLLGQLFSSKSFNWSSNKSNTVMAPKTPPPSQKGDIEPPSPDALCDLAQITPATPVSPPENPRPAKRRRIVRITAPEPNSLYDIMHDHAGKSLFINPICWTDEHAQLLGVRFVKHDPIRKPVPDFNSTTAKYPPRPSKIATDLSRDLSAILASNLPTTLRAMKDVMNTLFSATLSKPQSEPGFHFHFGDRRLKNAVRVHLLWKHPDDTGYSFDSAATKPTSSYGKIPAASRKPYDSQGYDQSPTASQPKASRPLLAFINKPHVSAVRRNLYRVAPGPLNGDRQNKPVANLQRLRSKRLIPAECDNDAYLVSVMLAMAQSQCYPPNYGTTSRSSSQNSSQGSAISQIISSEPEFKDVPIKLICHDNANAEFVVYNTVVTAAYLKRFSEPAKAPAADAPFNGGLEVNITRVQIWPVLGLKERLAQALGEEIAGAVASNLAPGELETWGSEQEHTSIMNALKRPRESVSLSDVFNTSFDASLYGGPPGAESPPPSPGLGSTGLGLAVTSPQLSPRTPKRRRMQAKNELQVF